jgi:hypothetical protein
MAPILRHCNVKRYNVLEKFIPMSKRRNEILKNCKEDLDKSFNIFRDLAIDSKFNEVNHSKMLIKIFSSDTPDIGDEEYLNIFIKLIENIKRSKIDHHFDKKFRVEKEVGRTSDIEESGGIDILISDNNYCIIIENKITDKAPDIKNQLARYYKIVKELKKEPVAIVYMPFYYRIPPLNNYTGEYKELVNIIEKLLIILPAWDPKNHNDLTHGFLDKCVERAKSVNNMTAAVCLDQYSKFIIGKGDLEQMAKNENKEFIKQILSDADMQKTVEDIVEIWTSRHISMGELFLDYLIEKHKFKKNTTGYYGEMLNDDIFIYFAPYKYQLGFGSINGKIPQDIQDELKKILEKDIEFIKFEGADCSWVYGSIIPEVFTGNLENMYKILSQKILEYVERISKKL